MKEELPSDERRAY